MSKIKATIITKSNNIPDNKMSVDIKKDSVQTPVENKNTELIIQPPYSTSALSSLFNMNAYHKRCCLVKAGITVRLGFTIYDPKKAEREPDEEYNRAETFVDTYLEEIHNFQLDSEIFGNGYLEIVRNGKGQPSEIYHITAKDSTIRLMDKVRLLREQISGTTIEYIPYMGTKYKPDEKKRREYIHWKNYNPESRYYGMPEYSGAITTMYLDESAKTYNTNKFSDPVPETLIALGGLEKDADAEAAITNFFKGNFGDATKAGRKALLLQFEDLTGGLSDKIIIEKLERENKDVAFRGMRSDNREEIIAAHGLTPRLVGVESIGKLGGGGEVKEQLKLVNEIVFIPRKKQLARIVNNLFEGMEIKDWKVKFNNFEFANATEDAEFYSTMVQSGIITPDYAAQEMGYPVPEQQGGEITKSDKFAFLAKQLKALRLTLESMKED